MATMKPNPFAKKAAPFEKSKKDKEPKGMKEGSKKEMAMDKKQAGPGKMPMFKKGGMAKC
jgi:hypothetical protein